MAGQSGPRKKIEASLFIWREPTLISVRECLYPRTYWRKFVTATVAPGGVGKSGLSVVEALAMVTGRDLLKDGFHGEPLRVWYWCGEDPLEEVERQFHAAAQHFRISPADVGERLFVDSGRELPIRIVYNKGGEVLVDVDSQADIMETIRQRGIDVATFDPIVKLNKASENSNEAMDALVTTFAQIANDTNSGVGLVAHTRKQQSGAGGEISADDARGGRALVDGTRLTRVLNRMTQPEAEKAGISVSAFRRYFWIGADKANLIPPDAARSWRYLESVCLPNGQTALERDNVRVVTAWSWPDAFSDVTTSDLQRFQQSLDGETRRNRASAQSPDWAGFMLAELLELDAGRGLAKAELTPEQMRARAKSTNIIRAWLASGALFSDVANDDKKKRDVPVIRVGAWANA